jgi:hypothetical protein
VIIKEGAEMYTVIPTSRYGFKVAEFDTEKKALAHAKNLCKEHVLVDYCSVYSTDTYCPALVSVDHRTGRAEIVRPRLD